MRRRVILLLLCVLLTAGCLETAASPEKALTEEEALAISFESTGAAVLESTISCWAKLNDSFLTIKQVEAEMSRIAKTIDPDKATIVKNTECGDQINKIVLYCRKGSKAYSMAVESVKQGNKGETYVVLDVSIDESYKDLKAERQNIVKALAVTEDSINVSSCIIGTYKGKLDERDVEKKSRIALQSINAKKVEGIEDGGMRSISAFSSNVGSYVMSNRARVNVQLAIRYSSYEDKTYIWIGTPLIPIEY